MPLVHIEVDVPIVDKTTQSKGQSIGIATLDDKVTVDGEDPALPAAITYRMEIDGEDCV